MKTSMLEYSKMILSKVSFNRKIFRKEYRKSKQWLNQQEVYELRGWLRSNKPLPTFHTETN
jgi:hypothetical protein